MVKELSLFTGAGGGLLSSILLGWKTVGYVEIDDYCQRILKQRIKEGYITEAPIFSDIKTFISEGYAESYKGMVDVIMAGFPCQAFSTATHGRKTAENLWPEAARVISIIEPKATFLENVQKRPIEIASKDLSRLGYKTKKLKLSTKDLGGDHIRRRYWLFGYTDDESKSMLRINAETSRMSIIQKGLWEDNPQKITSG